MSENLTVSVIIPAHNAARTLERALESVLIQDYPIHEIIVVDDCSKDSTPGIAASYASRGVKLVRLEQNRGAAGARNVGVASASGEFIAFQDADDEWVPGKLSAQMALFEADPSLSLVSCACHLISPDGVDLGDIYQGRKPVTGPDAWQTLLVYNFIATPSVVTRREALARVGGFDPTLRIAEDQDMWIRLACLGPVGYVPEVKLRVHLLANSLSSGNFRDQIRYTLPMIRRHLDNLHDRLPPRQRTAIFGERLSRLGRVAMSQGYFIGGLQLVLQSILIGHKPLLNLWYICDGSPPARLAKRFLHACGL